MLFLRVSDAIIPCTNIFMTGHRKINKKVRKYDEHTYTIANRGSEGCTWEFKKTITAATDFHYSETSRSNSDLLVTTVILPADTCYCIL